MARPGRHRYRRQECLNLSTLPSLHNSVRPRHCTRNSAWRRHLRFSNCRPSHKVREDPFQPRHRRKRIPPFLNSPAKIRVQCPIPTRRTNHFPLQITAKTLRFSSTPLNTLISPTHSRSSTDHLLPMDRRTGQVMRRLWTILLQSLFQPVPLVIPSPTGKNWSLADGRKLHVAHQAWQIGCFVTTLCHRLGRWKGMGC